MQPLAGGQPTLNFVGGLWEYRFERRVGARVSIAVGATGDLSVWTPIALLADPGAAWQGSATVAESGSGESRTVTVTETESPPPERRYFRVEVTPLK